MKKYSFLVYHKEYDEFLQALQAEGVIHVKEKDVESIEEGSELEEHINAIKRMQKTLSFLQKRRERLENPAEKSATEPQEVFNALELQEEISMILQELEQLGGRHQMLEKEMEKMFIWGDFNFDNITRLYDEGYEINFYSVALRNYDPEWEKTHNAIIISSITGKNNFITLNHVGNENLLDLEKASLGSRSISELRELLAENETETDRLNRRLDLLAVEATAVLEKQYEKENENLEWQRIYLNTDKKAENKLMLLQGFAPVDNTVALEAMLNKRGIYFQAEDPKPEEDVPVLLKNNAFVRLFEPIGKLYMLPRYNEVDLTPYFAPFFMIFFGLCLGDIGYGVFLLVIATVYKFIARKTIKPSIRSVMTLLQVLGISTFFCGLLTGGCFGFDLYEINVPWIQAIKDKVYLDNNQMFNLALILGVIQVIFGIVLRTANRIIQFGFSYGLSSIGWLVFLISMIAAVSFPEYLPMFGTIHLIIVGISAALIFFINSPGKNIFLNIGLGLWDTYNMATGLLGDILSYVRLFALGLSGGILASVFTSLAKGMSPDNAILGPIIAIIIFVIGHAINIFMNTLGAIVHPMRLTFVEFFKNSEFTGGGKQYHPFSKKN